MIQERPEVVSQERPDLATATALEEFLGLIRALEADWLLDERIRFMVEHEEPGP